MKKIVLISLAIFPILSVSAQFSWPNFQDSLFLRIESNQLTLKEKIGAYHLITEGYSADDMKNTYIYGMKGLELAQKAKDKKMMAIFYRYIGSTYTYRASYDTAYVYQQKQMELAEELQNQELLQYTYFGIGNLYARQGKFLQAVENYQKSMTFYTEDMPESVFIYDILENLENSFRYHSPHRTYLLCLGNAGECYRRLNNPERALFYLMKAMKIVEARNIVGGSSYQQIGRELGYVYFAQGDIDKATEYFMKVLSLPMGASVITESDCKEAMIKILILKKEYEKALEYAHDCLRLAERLGDPYIYVLAWNSFADIYRAQGNYRKCESAAMAAWNIDSVSVDTAPISAMNIAFANLYLGNKEKAEYFFRKSMDFNEQKSNRNFQEAMANVEVRYETEKKEMRIASLEKERQQYLILGGAGVLLAAALSILLWQKAKNTRREKQLIATRSVMEGEMSERARLARDLHDRLSGSLSAVKIGLNDNRESLQNVYDKLDGCIEEIRRVSHNLMPVSLQYGMKVALKDYAAQFPQVRFHFFGKDKRAAERVEFVVYCCAIELVNNSLKHSGAKSIDLQLVQDEKQITLTVQDNGCGFDEKNMIHGFGLKSIRDRVASCNGRIDIVTSPGKGTETTIDLKAENI